MTNDLLTALAREYAEEVYAEIEDVSLRERLIVSLAKGAEDSFRFLLRRFCLVEKSKVENIHKGILVQLNPKNFGYSPYNQGRMDVLKSLFPEIAKDVK